MGEVSDTIFLTVTDDNVRESAETFIHTISALSSRISGQPVQQQIY